MRELIKVQYVHSLTKFRRRVTGLLATQVSGLHLVLLRLNKTTICEIYIRQSDDNRRGSTAHDLHNDIYIIL